MRPFKQILLFCFMAFPLSYVSPCAAIPFFGQNTEKNTSQKQSPFPAPDRRTDSSDSAIFQRIEPEPPKVPAPVKAAPKISPELRRLLNISALKSELMFLALTCQKHKEYNEFITKFRPVLQQTYQALKIDFNKLYGSKGQMRLDQYMTDLADSASLKGAREGGTFCKTHDSMFHEAEYFKTPEDLAAYAEGKNLAVPLPKSPTGRRDISPFTAPESVSFASFAHPAYKQSASQAPQKPKRPSFVPVRKNTSVNKSSVKKPAPPLLAGTGGTSESKFKNSPSSTALFPENHASEAQKTQETKFPPLEAPKPYPDVSTSS